MIEIWTQIDNGLHVKYPLFLSDFNEASFFSADFRKMLKYQIWWKSVQWQPSSSMRTDGQTNRHNEANSRFSQSCERAEKGNSEITPQAIWPTAKPFLKTGIDQTHQPQSTVLKCLKFPSLHKATLLLTVRKTTSHLKTRATKIMNSGWRLSPGSKL